MSETNTQQSRLSHQTQEQTSHLPELDSYHRAPVSGQFVKVIGFVHRTPETQVTLRNTSYKRNEGFVEQGEPFNIDYSRFKRSFAEVK